MMQPTVTARLVGGATLTAKSGGKGMIITDPDMAADLLLRNEPAHIPGGLFFRERVRKVIAERALAGEGPDGNGINWSGSDATATR